MSRRTWKAVLALVMIVLIWSDSVITYADTGKEQSPDQFKMIDEYVLQEMKASKIPGLALGIVHGDEVIYTKGYGTSNGRKEPVTDQTPFFIGSVGKTFTALAIAQLMGDGKLKVTDTVRQYIPWFTLTDQSGGFITIKSLLEHTSGFSTASGNATYTYNANYTLEQTVRKINRKEKLNRPVGESYEYSNLNYVVLGLIIEDVSGLSYEEYITKYLFAPMQLEDSHASKVAAMKDGLAQGYRELYGMDVPVDYDYPIGQVPAGYQLSSARDMSKYLIYFLNNGYSGGNSILPNNQLLQPEDPLKDFESSASYYGLDWSVTTYPAYNEYNRFYGFLGSTANFNSALLISQVHRYGIIVLVNQHGISRKPELSAQVIGNGISDILLHNTMPTSIPRSFDKKQLLWPGLAILLCILSIYSCLRFHSKLGGAKQRIAMIMLLLWNIVIPIGFLIGVPLYYDNSWRFLLNVGPESFLPEFVLSLVLLICGVIKLYLIVIERYKSHK